MNLKGNSTKRILGAMALAAGLHGLPLASQTETGKEAMHRIADLRHDTRNKLGEIWRGAQHAIDSLSQRHAQKDLLDHMREANTAGNFHVGEAFFSAVALDHADREEGERMRLENMQQYNALLARVRDLVHQQHMPIYRAIPEVMSEFAYQRDIESLDQGMRVKRLRCQWIGKLGAALSADAGFSQQTFIRYYAEDPNTGYGHEAPIFVLPNGTEIDLQSGGQADIRGVRLPMSAIPEQYAAQHHFPTTRGNLYYMPMDFLAHPGTARNEYVPDPGTFYAERAFHPSTIEFIPTATGGSVRENRNNDTDFNTESDINSGMLNHFVISRLPPQTGRSQATPPINLDDGRYMLFETTPLPSSTSQVESQVGHSGVAEFSRQVVTINNQIGYQIAHLGNVGDQNRVYKLARVVGLYQELIDVIRNEGRTDHDHIAMAQYAHERQSIYQGLAQQEAQDISQNRGDDFYLQAGNGSGWHNLGYIDEHGPQQLLIYLQRSLQGNDERVRINAHDRLQQYQARAIQMLLADPSTRAETLTLLSGLSSHKQIVLIYLMQNHAQHVRYHTAQEIYNVLSRDPTCDCTFLKVWHVYQGMGDAINPNETFSAMTINGGRPFTFIENAAMREVGNTGLDPSWVEAFIATGVALRASAFGVARINSAYRVELLQIVEDYRQYVERHREVDHRNVALRSFVSGLANVVLSPRFENERRAWPTDHGRYAPYSAASVTTVEWHNAVVRYLQQR